MTVKSIPVSATLIFILLAINLSAMAGDPPRRGEVTFTHDPPRIDGVPDDQCWSRSDTFGDFIQYEPYGGAHSEYRTTVRMVFDNEAVYICAVMYDNNPDSIGRELGQRDGDRDIVADYFNVDIGPYNDGVNGYSFKVTASGIQSDIRRSSGAGGRDLNWDAVWQSAVAITPQGWVAELKIPFSAIRFSSESDGLWGINFWRYVQRSGEWSSWNWADKTYGTTINYLGEVEGFNAIDPPVRLSVTPYMSVYTEKSSGKSDRATIFSGGADLKVGISESFTLDATLVPDFRQVQYDDLILNLTPYEIEYNEKRQFFTEGTDLFGKANIFYSRRIGARPTGYYEPYRSTQEGEKVVSNDNVTRLLNAVKISGRNSTGLGIGIFNGITAAGNAAIMDTVTGESREYTTQPLTNYNMLVLDQNLGNGSYISLVNTNVLKRGFRDSGSYSANITAVDSRYLNPTKTWSIGGIGAISQKYYSGADNIFGHSISVSGGKTGGKFRLYAGHKSISKTYDPNDMGYLQHNNILTNSLTTGYNFYDPRGVVLSSLNTVTLQHDMLYSPVSYNSFRVRGVSTTTFTNFSIMSLESTLKPAGEDDYYEPRVDGRYYSRPPSASFGFSWSTDPRKHITAKAGATVELFDSDNGMRRFSFIAAPTLRYNNRLILSHTVKNGYFSGDIGFTGITEAGSIIFGERRYLTVENITTLSYIFSPSTYLYLRGRHYWSRADYTGNIYELGDGGSLAATTSTLLPQDINLNYFNLDLSWSWRFAPGSELNLVWKNSIYQRGDIIYDSLRENLNAMFGSPAVNSFSVKLLWYLDYHTIAGKI
ncbi:MAG: carbohydrate binding family 9 domain-containing protein [Bacteroidales bacterium]|nr:carbohydrate binding family 9 domain-containing protein [Bacteroidales bacterium]